MSTKITPSGSEEASRNHSESSFLIDKVKYILESPTQRTAYKRLKNEEDKIDFFLNHFIINDYTARQLKNLYLNDPQQKTQFVEAVDNLIRELEEENI
ncbi:hypothetical protein [Fulvivirga imtechensis]|nr:hypothetical protein [Fulvivirga imtechensis]